MKTPALPSPDAPAGHVWPTETGRSVLREACVAGAPRVRRDLAGQRGVANGSGASDVLIVQVGDTWCFKTSVRRCFDDADGARTALLELVQRKCALGPLIPDRTAIALRQDEGGRYWLWTVCPWVTTLRAAMTDAEGRANDGALGRALSCYARSVVEALLLAARRQIVLDVHPSNFAVVNGQTVYVDDDVADGRELPSIGHAVLRRIDEYGHRPSAVSTYVRALEREISERLTPEDIRALDLVTKLELARAVSPAVREARSQLVSTLSRGRKRSQSVRRS
ncbi:MAG: hypothetical protein ACOC97_02990 [Myxococcota bacterium]